MAELNSDRNCMTHKAKNTLSVPSQKKIAKLCTEVFFLKCTIMFTSFTFGLCPQNSSQYPMLTVMTTTFSSKTHSYSYLMTSPQTLKQKKKIYAIE